MQAMKWEKEKPDGLLLSKESPDLRPCNFETFQSWPSRRLCFHSFSPSRRNECWMTFRGRSGMLAAFLLVGLTSKRRGGWARPGQMSAGKNKL